jgi:hypothetical protein
VRQLSLFKGKRQRGIAPPPATEFAGHCVLADLIKRGINRDWRYTHIASGEYRGPITGARLKRMGLVPGWPDFMFCGPNAQTVFLELKRKKLGRVSETQAHIQASLIDNCFAFKITDDVGEAVRWLVGLGILRDKIEVQ